MTLPSIFFTCDVAHSSDLAASLRRNGVKAYPISGKTPIDERRRLIRLFREGEVEGLVSCQVLLEGFDAPIAMGAFMCRPTKSGLLYRQMVGRVLRPFPTPQGERAYQSECLSNILQRLRSGILNQLVVMATGLGKTHVAAQLPGLINTWKSGRPRGRLLFLCHRDELTVQAHDTFQQMNPRLTVGIEKAGSRADNADIVIGSVQTLGRAVSDEGSDGETSWAYGGRLAQLDPSKFDCVVCDEVHHGTAKTYQHIFRYMRALKGEDNRDSGTLFLGITATPSRSDSMGLEAVCDEIVYNYGIREGIQDKWLVRILADRVQTEVDISKVTVSRGDLAVDSLSSAINTPQRNELIAHEFLRSRDEHGVPSVSNGFLKPYCVVKDFADLTGRHQLCLLPSLFGLRGSFNAKGKDIIQQVEAIEKEEEKHPGLDLRDIPDITHLKATLQRVELLAPPVTPPAIAAISDFKWLQQAEGHYHLGLSDGRIVTIKEDTLGHCYVYQSNKGIKTPLHVARDLKEAIAVAERQIPAADKRWMGADCKWRDKPPTEEQVRLLWTLDRKLKGTFAKPSDLLLFTTAKFKAGDVSYSRGGISSLIDQARQRRAQ